MDNLNNLESRSTELNLHKERLLTYVDQELSRYSKQINPLLELRHNLFSVGGTEFDPTMSIDSQLYEHPAYNVDFIGHDMGLRNGNSLEYHQTTEKYDRGLSEEYAERDKIYRQAIMKVAQNLGFISTTVGIPTEDVDRSIGILDSELQPIEEKVAAIVINGAAGMSNVKRIRDAIRNIESGAIDTNRIILTAGTRPVGEAEKGRMKAWFRAGESEFESMKLATTDLLGVEFDEKTTVIPVDYGDNLTAKIQTAEAVIGEKVVTIEAVEAPYDTNRLMDDGSLAKRINTIEAFEAVLPLVEQIQGAIVMQSHDAWTPWQNLIAHKVFGIEQGRNIYPAGPFNVERVHLVEDNGQVTIDIASPQDVVDEIIKTYKQLVRMSVELQST
ncbi:hypothetical protein B7Z00_04365 [Candidatus Saccharibacteria bacterium 32-50-10]|nr:MAG: hypothetical protein B7Z00_04365 [Candidatus Saccharibacteria bacterium 32-50-10]